MAGGIRALHLGGVGAASSHGFPQSPHRSIRRQAVHLHHRHPVAAARAVELEHAGCKGLEPRLRQEGLRVRVCRVPALPGLAGRDQGGLFYAVPSQRLPLLTAQRRELAGLGRRRWCAEMRAVRVAPRAWV